MSNEAIYVPLHAKSGQEHEREQMMMEMENGHRHSFNHSSNAINNGNYESGRGIRSGTTRTGSSTASFEFRRIIAKLKRMFQGRKGGSGGGNGSNGSGGGGNSGSLSAMSLPSFGRLISNKLCFRFIITAIFISISLFIILGLSSPSSTSPSSPSLSFETNSQSNNQRGSSSKGVETGGFFKNLFSYSKSSNSPSARQTLMAHQLDALEIYAQDHLKANISFKNFKEFAYRQRVYKQLFDAYDENYDRIKEEIEPSDNFPIVGKDENDVEFMIENRYPMMPSLWKMEREMFPWAHKKFYSLLEMKRSFSGRGIVLPTGDGHFRYAVHVIRTLRWFNCTLPIWVAFSGPDDLSPDQQLYLKRMNTTLFDLSAYIDTDQLKLKGWQIRPFAMLAAPFKEVVVMDADIVWLQNPELIFEDEEYKKHHVIIFRDRTLFEGDKGKLKWIHENIPPPISPSIKATRMYRLLSAHEQDSSVIYWNKEKRFHSLLLSCKMNCKQERDEFFYKEFYGDKESFWIALEMLRETFTELWPTPGAMGKGSISTKTGQPVACGRVLQFDRLGLPLWLNGGIVYHKHHEILRNYLNNFTHYAREGKWDFITECLDANVTALDDPLKNMFDNIGKLFRVSVNLKVTPEEDFKNTLPPGLPTDEQIKASGKV